jgi:hypothetical protein
LQRAWLAQLGAHGLVRGSFVPPEPIWQLRDLARTLVAVQHAILTAIWNTGTTGTLYDDPGADFYTRLHPAKAKHRAIERLRRMGYRVTSSPPGHSKGPRREGIFASAAHEGGQRYSW